LESEKPLVDFARVNTFTCVMGVGSPVGALKGGGDHRPNPAPFRPMTGPHRCLWTINIAGSSAPKTAGKGMGERNWGSTTAIGPRTTGRGITPLPPVGRRWTISRRRGRDGCVKRRAAAGSQAPWRTCQKTDVQRDGGTRSLTGCWVWETTGPPSDAAGRSADIAGCRHI